MHEIPDAHGERDARRQDHQRTDDGVAGGCAQQAAAQNARQRDERRTADLAKAAGQVVPAAQQQIAAGKKACQRRRQRTAQCAAEDQRKAECTAHAADQLHPVLGKRDAPRQHQTALGFVQRHAALCDLAREGVHCRHPAQMSGAGRHIAHLADLGGARTGKDAVGQHVNMELPQVE